MSAVKPRPRPNISSSSGHVSETGSAVTKPKRELSPETRDKLAVLARERHKAGGFKKGSGGSKKSRKPSRSRVAQLVADAALEKKTAQAIIDVFKDGIHPSQPINIRLKAAEAWIGVEREEGKLHLKEEVAENESMGREDALQFLAERLTQSHAASLLRKRLEEQNPEPIPEAEVVEDIDE